MRISEREKNAIVTVFNKFKDRDSSLFLFGSKIDENKKGGDIDLLVVFEKSEDIVKFDRLSFLVELKKQIGERKIDLTMASQADLKTDPFLISIAKKAIKL